MKRRRLLLFVALVATSLLGTAAFFVLRPMPLRAAYDAIALGSNRSEVENLLPTLPKRPLGYFDFVYWEVEKLSEKGEVVRDHGTDLAGFLGNTPLNRYNGAGTIGRWVTEAESVEVGCEDDGTVVSKFYVRYGEQPFWTRLYEKIKERWPF